MPVISIALATFNGARYLEEQLDSIAAQTFSDFEVVVADDGSTDCTCEILKRRAAVDPRFRILTSAPAGGLQRNFERVIAATTGEWIAPCDQDDVWATEKLATLLKAVQSADAVMSYSDSRIVAADGCPVGTTAFESMTAIDGGGPLVFAFGNCISGHAMLFHRRLLEVALPFPEKPIYDWWIAAAATAIGRIVRVDIPLVDHRQHGANVTDLAGLERRRSKGMSRRARDQAVADRLHSFANLPGPVGEAYCKLSTFWDRCMLGRFSVSFPIWAWRRRRSLWAIRPGSYGRDLGRCLKFAMGR